MSDVLRFGLKSWRTTITGLVTIAVGVKLLAAGNHDVGTAVVMSGVGHLVAADAKP